MEHTKYTKISTIRKFPAIRYMDYTLTKVRLQGSLELALEEKSKKMSTFYDFFTQAYLIVSMDVWGI